VRCTAFLAVSGSLVVYAALRRDCIRSKSLPALNVLTPAIKFFQVVCPHLDLWNVSW